MILLINQHVMITLGLADECVSENSFLPSSSHPQDVLGRRLTFVTVKITRYRKN